MTDATASDADLATGELSDADRTPTDRMTVAFPASPTFTRIGRVAVVGLALRLGVDVSRVERLRGAVDAAVSALQGDGRISATARWSADRLEIELTNPQGTITDPEALAQDLSQSVGDGPNEPAVAVEVTADESAIVLAMPTERQQSTAQ